MEITPRQLIQRVASYQIEKIESNCEKGNPFDENILSLLSQEQEEAVELMDALVKWFKYPTLKNREKVKYEIADRINYNMYIFGAVDPEITSLARDKTPHKNTSLLPIIPGSPYKWGKGSRSLIEGFESEPPLHPDLVKVISRALSYGVMDLVVIWVFRGEEEQNKAYTEGCSEKKWPESIHNQVDKDGYVCAVDVVPYLNGDACWQREQGCVMVGLCLAAAVELKAVGEITHEIRSGADWDMDGEFLTDQKLDDIAHLELVKKVK